jgi:hypothetical protein
VVHRFGRDGSGGGGVTTNKVSIPRVLWFSSSPAGAGELLDQSTRSNPNAVITLSDTVTGEMIATLPNLPEP